MTASSPSDSPDADCAGFVAELLDWLDDDVDSATVDAGLELLSSRRRRLALSVIRSHDEALTLPDLAEAVAERERDAPIVDIPAERVSRTYLSLYHDHLPRLVDAGLLEYDQDRDLVTPGAI